MGVTFQEVYSFLVGLINPLPVPMAKQLVNDARKQLYGEREWGFLYQEGYIIIPSLINTSSVSVTKFSKDVIVSASIKTIIDNIEADPNNVSIIGRQIKIDNQPKIYTINDWISGDSKLVLDDIWLFDTKVDTTYEIFKAYYHAPKYQKPNGDLITDFRRFHSIIDIKNQSSIFTNLGMGTLNSRDPTRLSVGTATNLVGLKLDSDGDVLYELYPHEKNKEDKVLKVLYLREGYDFEDDEEEFPYVFSRELIRTLAKQTAYEWAEANKGRFRELRGSNWLNLIIMANNSDNIKSYDELLADAIKKDEEEFPKSLLSYYDSFQSSEVWGANNVLHAPDNTMIFDF